MDFYEWLDDQEKKLYEANNLTKGIDFYKEESKKEEMFITNIDYEI